MKGGATSSSAPADSTIAAAPVAGNPATSPAGAPVVGCPAFSPIPPGMGEASNDDAEVAAADIGGATKSATTSSTKAAQAAAPVEDMTALRGERRMGIIRKGRAQKLRGSTARACTYTHKCVTQQIAI